MYVRTITAAVALAAAVAVSAAVRRHRCVVRTLARERAAHRLTDGCLHRDMQAFQLRIHDLMGARTALVEADLVLDDALALHHADDPTTEGGPR